MLLLLLGASKRKEGGREGGKEGGNKGVGFAELFHILIWRLSFVLFIHLKIHGKNQMTAVGPCLA